jgi:UbiD family decarboxylase
VNAPASLRQFLADLEQQGDLLRIADEVDPVYEISAVCREVSDHGSPAVVFENVRGSELPVVANVYGTRRRVARALGFDEATLLEGSLAKLQERHVAPAPEPAADHLASRTVLRGDDVDLTRLPVPVWNVGDGGPFITAGVVLAESRDGPNAGIYRMQLHDRRTVGLYMAPDHHVRRLLEAPGRTDPVAVSVAIGAPPALFVAASSDFAAGESELAVAATFLPGLQLAEGLTVSMPWPVEAEIVLEGTLDGTMRQEGPLVEFTGYQSGDGPRPVLTVTAMHYRPDAVYHAAYVHRPPSETATVWRELEEAVALRVLRERYPIVTAVHRPPDIGRDFFCVIQVDRERAKPGMIRNLLAGAAYCLPRPKYVVAVDLDVDPYRLESVLWAMCMRVHPERDTVLVPDTLTSPLDPRGPEPPLTAKLLVDATTKADSPGRMSGPPPEAVRRAIELLGNRTEEGNVPGNGRVSPTVVRPA